MDEQRERSPVQHLESALPWTPDREHLRDLLGELHPDAAAFYVHAVEALQVMPLNRVRLMVAGHCVRELIPSLLEMEKITKSDRIDVNRAAKNLFEAWRDEGLALDLHDAGGPEPVANDLYTVSGTVFRRARDVATTGAEANHNSRAMTALVATGVTETLDDAPIRRLHSAIERFRSWTHRQNYGEPPRPLPTVESVEAELTIIEQALLAQMAHRGDQVRRLRQILSAANIQVEGEL